MFRALRISGVLLIGLASACGRSSLQDPAEDTAGSGGSGAGPAVCAPGTTEPCFTGPAGTLGVGICAAGTKTCNSEGTAYSACEGEVLPGAENCATQADDDCDGQVNEGGAGCLCTPGSSSPCYGGPPGTEGIGICAAGTQVCNADGISYGSCSGAVMPAVENCGAPEDEDCDGQANLADNDCLCLPGAPQPCYMGPAGTDGVGMCHGGTETCNAQGSGYGACIGEVTPVPETCNTLGDDDCNGIANEQGAGCVCFPGSVTGCYSGPDGTEGQGICHGGAKTCNAQGTGYGNCIGEVLPGVETCNTPEDDDCNGLKNESGAGCVCFPDSFMPCPYSGPPGTENVGNCQAGWKVCNSEGTAFGPCLGEILPKQEICNKTTELPEDENCDGQINEGGACQVVAIAAGGQHSVALRGDGTVWTWGSDEWGQLGVGPPAPPNAQCPNKLIFQSAPVMAVSMVLTFAVAAGQDHSLGLRVGDDIWLWGDNHSYQLGKPDNSGNPNVPQWCDPYAVYVYNFSDATAMAAGRAHTLGRRMDGSVWTWGANDFGQLGGGTTGGTSMMPQAVPGLIGTSAIAAGSDHCLVLQADGMLRSWGMNSFGQLGDGTYLDNSLPQAILGIDNVTAIDGGGAHSLALRSDGVLWAWGDNAMGQLGDGTTATRNTPAPVLNLAGMLALSAGFSHSLAVRSDGTVWAWGSNQSGQLGNGTTTGASTPVAVSFLPPITAVAAGGAHSLALGADGRVWAWGSNSQGQLGDGTTTDQSLPVLVNFP